MTEKKHLAMACEQFLGKSVNDIKAMLQLTMEGHLRAILGTLTVDEIYQDRKKFATLVHEVAASDVKNMGIKVLSFVIKDIIDHVNYLSSIGHVRTAIVKKDAAIGVAEANRDSEIADSKCKKAMMEVKYKTDTNVANSKYKLQVNQAVYKREVDVANAKAQLSYEAQAVKEKQKIRREQIEIDVVQRRKQIDVEEREILRKAMELEANVRRPAEAEAYKMKTLAEGKKTKMVEAATADAEKLALLGSAEAHAIKAVGNAEAESMLRKAAAYKQYGDAAMVSLVLDALPKMAAEVSAPLSRLDKIVMLNGNCSNARCDAAELLADLPTAVQTITGVDISQVVNQIPRRK